MKKIIYSIKKCCSVLLLSLLFIGCDDFLTTAPSTQITDADAFSSVTMARSILKGIYRDMNNTARYGYGYHNVLLVRECMGPDIIVAKTWYKDEMNYSTFTQDQGRVSFNWNMMYRYINNANVVIANINSIPGEQTEKDMVMGEALALRAFSYFELVVTFAPTYRIGASKKGVPIYLEPTTAETKGNPRSTVQEVYDQILADLLSAKEKMTTSRDSKSHINSNVIDGLLARVYLTMGNYSEAANSANAARQGFPLMSAADWITGFRDINNVEWMWGQDNTPAENGASDCLAWQYDLNANNESSFHASDALVSLYSATDIRKTCYYVDVLNGYWGSTKFLDSNPVFTSDLTYMRSSEMYLIEAEALARTGSTAQAQTLLLDVQQARDASAVSSGNTGQALIDEIIIEKRKELWGEGIYFLDMIRTGIPLVRDPLHISQLTIPADSWRFIWQIPQQEFLINTSVNITTDQNPSSGQITK